MEKLLDKFMSLLDRMPVYAQIIGLFVLSFLIAAYKIFSNEKIQRTIITRFQKKLGKLTEKQLHLHRLFDRQEVYKSLINNIRFNSHNKTIVFRKIFLSSKCCET